MSLNENFEDIKWGKNISIELLKKFKFFKKKNDSIIKKYLNVLNIKKVNKNLVIYNFKDIPNNIFLILEGEILVYESLYTRKGKRSKISNISFSNSFKKLNINNKSLFCKNYKLPLINLINTLNKYDVLGAEEISNKSKIRNVFITNSQCTFLYIKKQDHLDILNVNYLN